MNDQEFNEIIESNEDNLLERLEKDKYLRGMNFLLEKLQSSRVQFGGQTRLDNIKILPSPWACIDDEIIIDCDTASIDKLFPIKFPSENDSYIIYNQDHPNVQIDGSIIKITLANETISGLGRFGNPVYISPGSQNLGFVQSRPINYIFDWRGSFPTLLLNSSEYIRNAGYVTLKRFLGEDVTLNLKFADCNVLR